MIHEVWYDRDIGNDGETGGSRGESQGRDRKAPGKGVGKEHANPAGEKMFKIRPLDGDRM